MTASKPATLTQRIELEIKPASKRAAALEQSSLANTVKMRIREPCTLTGVSHGGVRGNRNAAHGASV